MKESHDILMISNVCWNGRTESGMNNLNKTPIFFSFLQRWKHATSERGASVKAESYIVVFGDLLAFGGFTQVRVT